MSVPAIVYGYVPSRWQAQLAAAAPDLPIGPIMTWVSMESIGNPAAGGLVGKSTGGTIEAGLTQIDFDDPPHGDQGGFAAGRAQGGVERVDDLVRRGLDQRPHDLELLLRKSNHCALRPGAKARRSSTMPNGG